MTGKKKKKSPLLDELNNELSRRVIKQQIYRNRGHEETPEDERIKELLDLIDLESGESSLEEVADGNLYK